MRGGGGGRCLLLSLDRLGEDVRLMRNIVLGTLGLICIGGCIAATLSMLYHFFYMLGSVEPGKKQVLNFFGPLIFVYPGLFDEAGRRARWRCLLSAVVFAACFVGAGIIIHAWG